MKLTKRDVPTSEGNGISNFLKISDGQSATGVFRGECHEFWQSWPKGGQKQVFSEPMPGSQTRFRANFIVHEEGKFVARVWEFGLKVYNMLAEIGENYDLDNTKIKISRRGNDKSTQWIILPLGPVDAKSMPSIKSVELNVLDGSQEGPKTTDEGGF
jgi:hypothetical protein